MWHDTGETEVFQICYKCQLGYRVEIFKQHLQDCKGSGQTGIKWNWETSDSDDSDSDNDIDRSPALSSSVIRHRESPEAEPSPEPAVQRNVTATNALSNETNEAVVNSASGGNQAGVDGIDSDAETEICGSEDGDYRWQDDLEGMDQEDIPSSSAPVTTLGSVAEAKPAASVTPLVHGDGVQPSPPSLPRAPDPVAVVEPKPAKTGLSEDDIAEVVIVGVARAPLSNPKKYQFRKYQCPYSRCFRWFMRWATLVYHLKEEHGIDPVGEHEEGEQTGNQQGERLGQDVKRPPLYSNSNPDFPCDLNAEGSDNNSIPMIIGIGGSQGPDPQKSDLPDPSTRVNSMSCFFCPQSFPTADNGRALVSHVNAVHRVRKTI